MSDTPKPVNPEKIKCDVCLKEVPLSEAHVPEAEDYVVSFCGLECYDTWIKRADKNKDKPKPSRSK